MKITINGVIAFLVGVLFMFLMASLLAQPAKATGCFLCQGPPGPEGPQGPQGDPGPAGPIGLTGEAGLNGSNSTDYLNDNYLTSNDFDQMFAAGFALSGIDFTNTTNALQLGIGVGGWGGEVQTAVGAGLLWDSDSIGDVLFSFKTTVEEIEVGDDQHRPWVASAVWKVKIW